MVLVHLLIFHFIVVLHSIFIHFISILLLFHVLVMPHAFHFCTNYDFKYHTFNKFSIEMAWHFYCYTTYLIHWPCKYFDNWNKSSPLNTLILHSFISHFSFYISHFITHDCNQKFIKITSGDMSFLNTYCM